MRDAQPAANSRRNVSDGFNFEIQGMVGRRIRGPVQQLHNILKPGLTIIRAPSRSLNKGVYILSLTGRFAGCRGPVLVAMRSPKSGFSGHGPLCYVRTD